MIYQRGDPWAAEVLRRFLDRLHALGEWEAELSHHDGYAAGYAACSADVAAAMRMALGGSHARTWRQAVAIHHRALDARRRRAAADAPCPRPGDHPGGPVPWNPESG